MFGMCTSICTSVCWLHFCLYLCLLSALLFLPLSVTVAALLSVLLQYVLAVVPSVVLFDCSTSVCLSAVLLSVTLCVCCTSVCLYCHVLYCRVPVCGLLSMYEGCIVADGLSRAVISIRFCPCRPFVFAKLSIGENVCKGGGGLMYSASTHRASCGFFASHCNRWLLLKLKTTIVVLHLYMPVHSVTFPTILKYHFVSFCCCVSPIMPHLILTYFLIVY